MQLVTATESDATWEALPSAAIDAGADAVASLGPLATSGDNDAADRASLALAYIGGREAVEALRQRWAADPEPHSKALLVATLASTGSEEDRAFLRTSLAGEHFGDDWPPIAAAALALGVLRDGNSRDDLATTARKTPGSIASSAAEEALRWIDANGFKVAFEPENVDEQVIAAVLGNGVPNTDRSTTFFDSQRQVLWRLENGSWHREAAEPTRNSPGISFNVHVSPDGERALVSVGTHYGPLDGMGHDFVLKRQGATWRVQSVLFIWIS